MPQVTQLAGQGHSHIRHQASCVRTPGPPAAPRMRPILRGPGPSLTPCVPAPAPGPPRPWPQPEHAASALGHLGPSAGARGLTPPTVGDRLTPGFAGPCSQPYQEPAHSPQPEPSPGMPRPCHQRPQDPAPFPRELAPAQGPLALTRVLEGWNQLWSPKGPASKDPGIRLHPASTSLRIPIILQPETLEHNYTHCWLI